MAQGRYRIVSIDRQMGIGLADSWQITVSAVAKRNVELAPYTIPNELICAELGRFLGLPVPPSGIVVAPRVRNVEERLWFASLDFNLTGDPLPPVDPVYCFEHLPDLSTGVLLFDVWMANCDRNRGNLSVDKQVRPPRLSVFDHGLALLGGEAGRGLKRLAALKDRLGISFGQKSDPHSGPHRHCLLDAVTHDQHFGKWIGRIETIPDYLIEETCRRAVDLGIGREESDAVCAFLRARRGRLRDIIEGNKSSFSGITQWSLFT